MRSLPIGLAYAASLLLALGTRAGAQEVVGQALGDTGADLVYTPVSPCRIIDTRLVGGPLVPGSPRDFRVVGTAGFVLQGGNVGGCGIPAGATAVMLNFVAAGPAGNGNLRAWAFGQIPQLAAIVNYGTATAAIANGVVVPICNPAGGPCALDLTVSANASATELVVDVMGYMQGVAPEAVTTDLLADGAVTLGKLDTNAVDASKIVDGSVGAAEVDNTQVQLRVGSSCPAGESIRAINDDGTVTCETDDVGPAGTVTSITAGTGLTGGTITSSGTIEVDFAGSGSATTAARSDHTHAPATVTLIKTIPAITCTAQGSALSGDASSVCSGQGTVRTDGDSAFPCVVSARPTRDTWVCALDLPSNAQITNIIATGLDGAPAGYMEASVWRTPANTLGPDYFSNFGGNWQSSGAAFSGFFTFPIFSAAPHSVAGDYRYVIGFGLKAPVGQFVYAYGFRVTYTTTQ